jgi:hypothetical protein
MISEFFFYLLSESDVIRTMYCCIINDNLSGKLQYELEFHASRKILTRNWTRMFSILCATRKAKSYFHCLHTLHTEHPSLVPCQSSGKHEIPARTVVFPEEHTEDQEEHTEDGGYGNY